MLRFPRMAILWVAACVFWPAAAFNGPSTAGKWRKGGGVVVPASSKVKVEVPKDYLFGRGPGWPIRVNWQYTEPAPGQAKVVLYQGGHVIHTFANDVPWGTGGNGARDWMMPDWAYGSAPYRIGLSSTTDSTYFGASAEFISMPFIRIYSPAFAGKIYKVGTTAEIHWYHTAGCGDTVNISAVLTNYQWKYGLATEHPVSGKMTGFYRWTISSSIPPGNYNVYVSGHHPFCHDKSPSMTITP
jgi:hypothetical protein